MIYQIGAAIGTTIVASITVWNFINIVSTKLSTTKFQSLIKGTVGFNKVNILAILVFIGVLWWLRNPIPAILASIMVVYLPSQIAYIRTKRFHNHVMDQLAMAVGIFADSFMVTKNIPRSIEAVGKGVPDPVGRLFLKTYTELTFGKTLPEVAQLLAQSLGVPFAYVFSGLLVKAQNQGDLVSRLFTELSTMISNEQEEANFQMSQVSTTRMTNLFILFVPLPFYIILYARFPEVMSAFVSTSGGRLLFSLWLVCIIISFLIDRLVVDV